MLITWRLDNKKQISCFVLHWCKTPIVIKGIRSMTVHLDLYSCKVEQCEDREKKNSPLTGFETATTGYEALCSYPRPQHLLISIPFSDISILQQYHRKAQSCRYLTNYFGLWSKLHVFSEVFFNEMCIIIVGLPSDCLGNRIYFHILLYRLHFKS